MQDLTKPTRPTRSERFSRQALRPNTSRFSQRISWRISQLLLPSPPATTQEQLSLEPRFHSSTTSLQQVYLMGDDEKPAGTNRAVYGGRFLVVHNVDSEPSTALYSNPDYARSSSSILSVASNYADPTEQTYEHPNDSAIDLPETPVDLPEIRISNHPPVLPETRQISVFSPFGPDFDTLGEITTSSPDENQAIVPPSPLPDVLRPGHVAIPRIPDEQTAPSSGFAAPQLPVIAPSAPFAPYSEAYKQPDPTPDSDNRGEKSDTRKTGNPELLLPPTSETQAHIPPVRTIRRKSLPPKPSNSHEPAIPTRIDCQSWCPEQGVIECTPANTGPSYIVLSGGAYPTLPNHSSRPGKKPDTNRPLPSHPTSTINHPSIEDQRQQALEQLEGTFSPPQPQPQNTDPCPLPSQPRSPEPSNLPTPSPRTDCEQNECPPRSTGFMNRVRREIRQIKADTKTLIKTAIGN